MSFFQMKLAKFPKTFGLTELKKGYFPHLFNTDDHQTYVGSLPDQHYYMPDGMTVDDRDAFRRWHDKLTREGYVFDFRHELLEYCKSDVLLLKQGCMTFKREFEAKAGFDPFDQMTIASACNRYLRTHCLQPNTIACEPLLGWGGRRVNQSSAAFEWLAWEAHLVSTPLRHAHNGGEVRPLPDRRYTVDGFDATTQTVYEFDGCFWQTPRSYHGRRLRPTSRKIRSSSPTRLPRPIDLGMRVVPSTCRRSRHPNLPAIAPDPSPARSARRLLRWTYQRLPTLPTRGRGRTDPLLRFQEPVPLRQQVLPLPYRSSPDHLPTTSRPRPRRVFRARVLYHLTAHRTVASRLAVPMQPETHVPVV